MSKNQHRAESKIEAQIAFIWMKYGVDGPEIDECAEWAFGKGAWYIPIYPDWINRWELLHPEFTVKKSDSFVEWMAVVGFLFAKYKEHTRLKITPN